MYVWLVCCFHTCIHVQYSFWLALSLSLSLQPAFSLNSKIAYDYRTHAMNLIKSMPLDYLMCRIYPRLYALHMLTENVSEHYIAAQYFGLNQLCYRVKST